MTETTGRFISLEGGDGVGKSTNLRFAAEWLQARGKPVVLTREPGGTAMGEKIRAIFLGVEEIVDEAELLLVFAARAQHLRQVVEPALRQGSWVVCDRFTDASYAYQGGGRGIDREFIRCLEERVQKGLKPDLTLLLDAPVGIGLARTERRGGQDRMDCESIQFYERVRQEYLHLASGNPGRIKIVDASLPLEAVQAGIGRCLQVFLDSCA